MRTCFNKTMAKNKHNACPAVRILIKVFLFYHYGDFQYWFNKTDAITEWFIYFCFLNRHIATIYSLIKPMQHDLTLNSKLQLALAHVTHGVNTTMPHITPSYGAQSIAGQEIHKCCGPSCV